MSKLYYRYGAMNSGKSTSLLQDAYNYEERDQNVLVFKPTIDTKDDAVVSRLGLKRKVDIQVGPDDNILDLYSLWKDANPHYDIACLLVDEAQFLSTSQVNSFFYIAVKEKTPVIAYGIRTDFQGKSFPGSQRLLEIAHDLTEMKTICRCGRKAMFNARQVNGVFQSHGEQIGIDDGSVVYESMCGGCYLEKVGEFPA